MSIQNPPNLPKVKFFQTILIALLIPILGACTFEEKPLATISDFHADRMEEYAAMRKFRKCAEDGRVLDKKAGISGGSGGYLASAKVLQQCESEIDPSNKTIGTEERMQVFGLAIQNYVKGRDISSARSTLKRFKVKFPGKDFYYPDGTSFIVTMETLLGMHDQMSYGQFSSLNVNKTLKSEMRRLHYWKNK